MSKNKLVSVILPIYKVEGLLQKCVDGILSQTYKNIEVILVDDGSPDNCGKICEDYKEKDNRVIVIHKENGGIMSAWKAGCRIASGCYIYFVDPDDWIEQNYIENLVSAIDDNQADFVITDYYEAYDKFKIVRKGAKNISYGVLKDKELAEFKKNVIKNLNINVPFFRWNKLFKKEIVEKNMQYNNEKVECFEDVCITLSAILDSNKIIYTNILGYNYYQRNFSITHDYKKNLPERSLVYIETLKQLLKDKGVYDEKSFYFEKVRLMTFILEQLLDFACNEKFKVFKELRKYELFKEIINDKCFGEVSTFRKMLLKALNNGQFKKAKLLAWIRQKIRRFNLLIDKKIRL